MTPTRAAAAPSPAAVRTRVTEIRAVLSRGVPVLSASRDKVQRKALYSACLPLLAELEALNRPPFDRRAILVLLRETHWHLRALADLEDGTIGSENQHTGWLLDCIERLGGATAFG